LQIGVFLKLRDILPPPLQGGIPPNHNLSSP
jgi:hypothetical protein